RACSCFLFSSWRLRSSSLRLRSASSFFLRSCSLRFCSNSRCLRSSSLRFCSSSRCFCSSSLRLRSASFLFCSCSLRFCSSSRCFCSSALRLRSASFFCCSSSRCLRSCSLFCRSSSCCFCSRSRRLRSASFFCCSSSCCFCFSAWRSCSFFSCFFLSCGLLSSASFSSGCVLAPSTSATMISLPCSPCGSALCTKAMPKNSKPPSSICRPSPSITARQFLRSRSSMSVRFVLPGVVRRADIVCQQAYLFRSRLLQQHHGLHHAGIIAVTVALDGHRLVRFLLQRRGRDARHCIRLQGSVRIIGDVQIELAIGLDRQHQRLHVFADFHGLRLGVGQIHHDSGGQQRCGDHEDHQQHEHDVNIRDDVHVAGQLSFRAHAHDVPAVTMPFRQSAPAVAAG